MNDLLSTIMSSFWGHLIAFLADTSIVIAAIKWIWGMTLKEFKLETTGKTYKVRRKDFNVQTVTNGVAKDENMIQLPENIRNEIIQITKNPLLIVSTENKMTSKTNDNPSKQQ